MITTRVASILVCSMIGLAACQAEVSTSTQDEADAAASNDAGIAAAVPEVDSSLPESSTAESTPAEKLAEQGMASPGKPGAPVEIHYEVIGSAIVGHPVSINIVVTSMHSPLDVKYSISDTSALLFQAEQVEQLQIVDASSGSEQQITVIPQREGRLYVNVSAEVAADMGTMIRSMAIPIKVGSAPPESVQNGALQVGPDGEPVISLPAQPAQQ